MGKEVEEVMEGYKETEIGVLPEEWRVVRLGDVIVKAKAGGTPKTSETSFWSGKIPFVKVEDVAKSGKYLTDTISSITEQGLKNSNAWLVPKNSVILSMYGTAGEVKITRKEMAISQNVLGIIPNENVFIEFMYYALLWAKSHTLHLITDVTIFKHFTLAKAKQLVFPLPPLPEQRKIAYVLSTIQRAIELQDKVIAATRELKKSLMRHLFTYGPIPVDQIDRVSLKETEIGSVPEHWEVVRLEKGLSLIRNGISKKQITTTLKAGYPVTRIETISEDRINPDKVGYIDKLSPSEIEKFRLKPGDILFSHINSEPQIGRSVIYEGWPGILLHGMNLLLLRTNSNIIPRWLNYLFMYYRAIGVFIKIAARAVNQSSINQSKLKSLLIPLPPLTEQRKIAQMLNTVDQKIEVEEKRKSTLQSLFQTMLHLLMTGKVRMKDLEVNVDAPGR